MDMAHHPAASWFDNDLASGLRQGLLIGAAVLVLVLPPASPLPNPEPVPATPTRTLPERRLELGGTVVSNDARLLAQWVVASADNGDRHFAIVDKRRAQVLVFNANGRLVGATPVLLGYAAGDDTVPGIGQRPIEQVRPAERTTPAGRFVAQAGRNALNEDVVWVDYDAAVSMHRVRVTTPAERRLERLASPTADDNRISYGCINVPPTFFDAVVWPAFGQRRGIVYVLPEHKALEDVFPELATTVAVPAPPSDSATRAGS
jgi:hypothetical protein